MPLTPLQERILSILEPVRTPESYLAGGMSLPEQGIVAHFGRAGGVLPRPATD